MNRYATTAAESHRVNRIRFAAGLRHPEIHESPAQERLGALLNEIVEDGSAGHPNMHVLHYFISVADRDHLTVDVRVAEPYGARATLKRVPVGRLADVAERYAERGYHVDLDASTSRRMVLRLG